MLTAPSVRDQALVLIVEDDPHLNRFLVLNLASQYRVLTAFDGEQGLREAIQHRPDIVLTDLVMPRMTGDSLVREIRKVPELSTVPVILLTASADQDFRVRMLREGAQDYLLKPYSVEELYARIDNLVAIKRSREALQRVSQHQARDLESLAREVAARKSELELALMEAQASRERAESALRERKTVEDALRRAEEAARHAQKMEAIGRLASGIAHDFNNLLTVINGTCDLVLPRLGQDDPIRASIAQIRKAGERSSALTRQLLAISRKQPIAATSLDVNEILSGLIAFLERTLGEAVKVVPRLSPSIESVSADPGLLEQVFMNLAINARDAMPQGGRLSIETDVVDLDEAYVRQWADLAPGRYVLVAITDTGTGMTEEIRARIFEPFFTTKPPGKGTGLGLSIVYGIVKQLGGHVWVYSEVGRGTTFKVYLPVSAGPSGAAAEAPPVRPARRGAETVLLVEDEEAVRAVARQFLLNDGYQVLEAGDAEQALRIAGEHGGAIDLLLTDMGLPGMPGSALAESFRRIRPGAKVLFMTGYSEPPAEGSTRAGAVIQKPFTPDALAKMVAESLGSA